MRVVCLGGIVRPKTNEVSLNYRIGGVGGEENALSGKTNNGKSSNGCAADIDHQAGGGQADSGSVELNFPNAVVAIGQSIGAGAGLSEGIDGHRLNNRGKRGERKNGMRTGAWNIKNNGMWRGGGISRSVQKSLPQRTCPGIVRVQNRKSQG